MAKKLVVTANMDVGEEGSGKAKNLKVYGGVYAPGRPTVLTSGQTYHLHIPAGTNVKTIFSFTSDDIYISCSNISNIVTTISQSSRSGGSAGVKIGVAPGSPMWYGVSLSDGHTGYDMQPASGDFDCDFIPSESYAANSAQSILFQFITSTSSYFSKLITEGEAVSKMGDTIFGDLTFGTKSRIHQSQTTSSDILSFETYNNSQWTPRLCISKSYTWLPDGVLRGGNLGLFGGEIDLGTAPNNGRVKFRSYMNGPVNKITYTQMPYDDGSTSNNYYTIATNEGIAKGLSTINIGTTAAPVYSAVALKSRETVKGINEVAHIYADNGGDGNSPVTIGVDSCFYTTKNHNVAGYIHASGGNGTLAEGDKYCAVFGSIKGDVKIYKNLDIIGKINSTTIPTNQTLEVTSNKVALGSTNTVIQYPNAKSVWDECVNIREVAEGKCKSVIVSYNQTAPSTDAQAQQCKKLDGTNFASLAEFNTYIGGGTIRNSAFNSQDNSIAITVITDYIIDTDKIVRRCSDAYGLNRGDIVLVAETDVPDRWFTKIADGTFYIMETSKVDLSWENIQNRPAIDPGTGAGAVQMVQDPTTGSGTFNFKGANAIAEGLYPAISGNVTYGATGAYASTFGGKNAAQGKRSIATGSNTIAVGKYSHAEGTNSVAGNTNSHAEGQATTTSGTAAHAEGDHTLASGNNSHAEGSYTTALGDSAHAEGNNTTATGFASHAEGYYTQAGFQGQTVVGTYNDNKGTTLFEVGMGYLNGSTPVRKNAFEVHNTGKVKILNGSLFIGDTELTEANLQKLLALIAVADATKDE